MNQQRPRLDRKCRKFSPYSDSDSALVVSKSLTGKSGSISKNVLPSKVNIRSRKLSEVVSEPVTVNESLFLGANFGDLNLYSGETGDSDKAVQGGDSYSVYSDATTVYPESESTGVTMEEREGELGEVRNVREASDVRGMSDPSEAMGGPRSMSDANNFPLQELLYGLTQAVNTIAVATGASKSANNQSDMNRQIDNLAAHKDGVDVAKYIRKLEADLRDIGCPEERFKGILLRKMQSKAGIAAIASIDRDAVSYDQVKMLLIKSLGCSRTNLGIKLIADFD